MAYKTHVFKDKDVLTHEHMNNIIAGIDEAKSDVSNKQATLVSGTNIKTVNGQSILGSGNLVIEGGAASAPSNTLTTMYNEAKTIISRFHHQNFTVIEEPKEKEIDLILFTGQSNSCGRAQLSDCKNPEDLILNIPINKAFHFNGTKSTTPEQIVEPISANSTSTYGYIPAFLNAYYETTHHQVCACFSSSGGTNLNRFTKYRLDDDSKPTTTTNSLYTNGVNSMNHAKTQLEKLGYTIKGVYVVWCQGENDAYYYGTNSTYATKKEQTLTTPAEKTAYYKEIFRTLVDDWKADLNIDEVFIITIGHRKENPTKWEMYGPIVQAQKEAGKEWADCMIATTFFTGAEKFIEEDGSIRNLMRDNTHYVPEGYVRAGLDAGINAGIFVNSGHKIKPTTINYEAMLFEDGVKYERNCDQFIYDPYRIDMALFEKFAGDVVTSMSLNFTNATLSQGETIALIPTLYPSTITNKTVTYTSSNPQVAEVNANGIITAVGVGEAVITVTPNAESAVTASAQISVLAEKIPVESIDLNRTTASMLVGDKLQLNAIILPANATDKSVTWSSSDAGAASVDENGLVTALEQGDATITAVANGNPNLKASCVIQLAHKVIEAGDSLLDLDFTTKTVDDYIVNGVLVEGDADLTDSTYDGNGLNYGTPTGSYGLQLAEPIDLNQNFILEATLAAKPFAESETSKTEALYGYLMLVTGTDEHETHSANCFTPSIYFNKPKSTVRTIGGTTVTLENTGLVLDGKQHTYKYVYDAIQQKMTTYIDGIDCGTKAVSFDDGGLVEFVLGAHKGYSSAANFGPGKGISVKSLKISKIQ